MLPLRNNENCWYFDVDNLEGASGTPAFYSEGLATSDTNTHWVTKQN